MLFAATWRHLVVVYGCNLQSRNTSSVTSTSTTAGSTPRLTTTGEITSTKQSTVDDGTTVDPMSYATTSNSSSSVSVEGPAVSHLTIIVVVVVVVLVLIVIVVIVLIIICRRRCRRPSLPPVLPYPDTLVPQTPTVTTDSEQVRYVRIIYCYIFTALHDMQTWSSDENSVRPSVRPSVCLSVKRVDCDKRE